MAASETPTALGACPTDEDLAAFLDGMLPEPERARITAHLADCESCYEIFAGAVHFQQDSAQDLVAARPAAFHPFQQESVPAESAGRVVLFPFKDGGGGARKRWWIPAAAAAVLVLGIGFAGYRAFFAQPEPERVADLIGPLQSEADLASHLHRFTVHRGLGNQDPLDLLAEQPSFLVGARLVDLQIRLDKGQGREAQDLLRAIGNDIQNVMASDESAKPYLSASGQLLSGAPEALRKIKTAAPRWEAGLKDSFLDPDFLELGKWTEAGRLAAETRSADFFNRRNRRFLSFILRKLEGEQKEREKESASSDEDFDADAERDNAALAELRQIAALWDRGDLDGSGYDKLAGHFHAIIGLYDI